MEVITGNAGMAAECVINATQLSENHSTIFRDWLAQWARNATVRASLNQYANEAPSAWQGKSISICVFYGGHEVLSGGEVAALQQWPAMTLAAHRYSLSRARAESSFMGRTRGDS